jgi:hypothetical protein
LVELAGAAGAWRASVGDVLLGRAEMAAEIADGKGKATGVASTVTPDTSARVADAANRRVRQIEPKREGEDQASARILDYLNRELIILLGDPGAGKTHCFRTIAAAEQAPMYSVQRFLALNGDEQARTIYLDGLEEYRPRTNCLGEIIWLRKAEIG